MPGIPANITIAGRTPATIKGRVAPLIDTAEAARGGFRAEEGLLFSPNFNEEPDWAIRYAYDLYAYDGYGGLDGSNVPAGFDYMYSGERWHPNGDISGAGAVPGSQPVAQISNFIDANEKALIIHDESWGENYQWGSDIVLTKEFDTQYAELFVEIKVKIKPDWVWESAQDGITGKESVMKLMRVGNFRGAPTDNRYTFNTGANQGPLLFLNIGEAVYNSSAPRGIFKGAVRHAPYSTGPNIFSYMKENQASCLSILGDGTWHTLAARMVMNSAAGISDGIVQMWFDGNLTGTNSEIEWNRSAELNGIGLNSVAIGGNADNVPFDESLKHEQWWALKDFKVYDRVPARYL